MNVDEEDDYYLEKLFTLCNKYWQNHLMDDYKVECPCCGRYINVWHINGECPNVIPKYIKAIFGMMNTLIQQTLKNLIYFMMNRMGGLIA